MLSCSIRGLGSHLAADAVFEDAGRSCRAARGRRRRDSSLRLLARLSLDPIAVARVGREGLKRVGQRAQLVRQLRVLGVIDRAGDHGNAVGGKGLLQCR